MLCPNLFIPRGHYTSPPREVVILHRGPSPTTDIYFARRFERINIPHRMIDTSQAITQQADELFPEGAFVIIVRYLDRRFARLLAASNKRLAGMAYLLDDDIPGALSDPTIPRGYAWRLVLGYLFARPFLSKMCNEIWITSPGLKEKYAALNVKQINPILSTHVNAPPEPSNLVKVCYHATASHKQDLLWIAQVMGAVQKQTNNIAFEVIAPDKRLYSQAFGSIPRCKVVPPMSWTNYQNYIATRQFDIGLAPVVPGPFNNARSYNKALDIMAMGAVGIYTDSPPFDQVIDDGKTGLLRPNTIDAWSSSIINLAKDRAQRLSLHAAALEIFNRLAIEQAAAPFPSSLTER